jgi:integrase
VADYIAFRVQNGVPGVEARERPAHHGHPGRTYETGATWGRSAVEQALAAIGKAHDLSGQANPSQHVAVKAVRAGIARSLGRAPGHQADPLLLTETDPTTFAAAFPDSLGGVRDRALVLVGFTGALRRSELVGLDVEDVAFEGRGMVLSLRRHVVGSGGVTAPGTKADQEGRVEVAAIHAAREPRLCAVAAMKAWLAALMPTRTGPVFRRVSGGSILPGRLSPQHVGEVVKTTAAGLGLDAGGFSSHSLRAGLATSAAKAGVPLWSIQKQTRHRKLDTLAIYLRSVLAFDDNATEGLL